jgi:hypothetical protein
MPELKFVGSVLDREKFTFLNMRRVLLLALKYLEGESAIKSQGFTFSRDRMS